MTQMIIYFDRARQWADYAVDNTDGAIGSCWQMTSMDETECAKWLASLIEAGYTRAHWNAPRF